MIALAVDLCNSVAVTLFGIALSAAFCNIHWTPKAKKRMLLYTLMIFCLHIVVILEVVEQLTHLRHENLSILKVMNNME